MDFKIGNSIEFETIPYYLHKGNIEDIKFSSLLNEPVYLVKTIYGNYARLTKKELEYRSR